MLQSKMKKLIILISIIFIQKINAQTWVAIPDGNFASYLQSTMPSAMNGNSLNITSTLVTSGTQTINCGALGISNLSGIEYFTSLTYLSCTNNSLTSFPPLATTLHYILNR